MSTPPATVAPPARVKPPAADPGELVRLVVAQHGDRLDRETTVRRTARAGHEYWVRAACTSSASGTSLSFEVRNGKVGAEHEAVIASGDVPCDGQVTADGLGTLPAEPVVVYLRGDQTDVTSAYAVISPSVAG